MDLSSAGRIPICMKCGSRSVRHQTRGEGLWAAGGEGVAWVCEECHHIGAPFLADRTPDADEPPEWTAEFEDAAFSVDDDDWDPPPPPSRRRRSLGGLFILVGVLFLIPVVGALHQATSAGSVLNIAWALAGTGWLLAIGLAMFVVGLRRMRSSGEESGTDAVAHAAAPDDASDESRG